jgi:hypothetical protein
MISVWDTPRTDAATDGDRRDGTNLLVVDDDDNDDDRGRSPLPLPLPLRLLLCRLLLLLVLCIDGDEERLSDVDDGRVIDGTSGSRDLAPPDDDGRRSC